MSGTITSRRERYHFYKAKLRETTLFITIVLRKLYYFIKNSRENLNSREIIVVMRDDEDILTRFRTTFLAKYSNFINNFKHCVLEARSLMFLDKKLLISTMCPIIHMYNQYVEFLYRYPYLMTQDDNEQGEIFTSMNEHWEDVIFTFMETINEEQEDNNDMMVEERKPQPNMKIKI